MTHKSILSLTGVLAMIAFTAVPAFATISIVSSGTTSSTQYSLSGSAYTQNFDSLTSTNASFPDGNGTTFVWANNVKLANWYLNAPFNATSPNNFKLSNGASNPANLLSLGVDNGTDRALSISSNTTAVTDYVGFGFTNNSGSAITSFTIGYTGEQWREATNVRTQALDLSYRINGTEGDLTGGTWTSIASCAYASSGVLANGTDLLGSTVLTSGVISQSLAVGDSIFFRWTDTTNGINNSQDIIGIDDVTTGFTAIPEPATYGMLLGALGLGLALYRRVRR